ncbi:alpha/beta hydrolase [Rhodococcus sp. 105337]|nr:alpha/beta hydrolase [Rhodococcus sp. 105337]
MRVTPAPEDAEHVDTEALSGYLHSPSGSPRGVVALTHGAGGNCNAKILQLMCARFAAHGFVALRYDLPFRRRRPKGPPQPSRAGEDREGIAAVAAATREYSDGPLILGGVSYGGRQVTMLAAERPGIADGLLLMSYPLHPPGKPDKPRTEHLPALTAPSVFVHGDRDPFGTLDELRDALALVPAPTTLVPVEGAAHDLGRTKADPSEIAVRAVLALVDGEAR